VKTLRVVLMAMAMLTSVTAMAGVVVKGNVYGGGNLAAVGGNVMVNMKAGTVEKDVYGGGALANTNINNIPAENYTGTGEETGNTFTYTTNVNLMGGEIHGDAYGGGLGRIGVAAVEAVEGVHFTQEEIDAAQEGDDAYGKTTDDWKTEPVQAVAGVEAVAAMVYGNVNVTLGSSEEGSTATKFYISHYGGEHAGVVKSGRVFGCNNLNGSPLGDVTVTVWKTVRGSTQRSETADKSSTNATYELAAVYGGGNLANYTATGKKTHVVICGCSDSSIEYVYGGGNAAAVPEASVDINGAYEIGYVFGGGNGADEYTLDNGTSWNANPGANVNTNATTVLYGGVIHEAFGGSNEKGTISGTVSINSQSGGTCPLSISKLYGAGKNADIEGDLIVVMGCMPGDENPTDEVYGGAENANVKGNVELTITSGSFRKVFGGNNQSGAIFGHIKLNIEETGCKPIKIDELYLGGYNAPYSVYGYKNTGTADAPVYAARTSTEDGDAVTFDFNNNTKPDETSGQYDDPVLNIVSCTSIGKVFGGGLGEGAVIYGNPTVNINMINGTATGSLPTLGTIGDVYGGGNQAVVEGNTTVNIGTETTVTMTSVVDDSSTTDVNESLKTVEGANITGNVYGGGNLADVTGNTYVYVCAKESGDDYVAVAEGRSKVIIGTDGADADHGNVFGGGKGEAAPGSTTGAFECAKAMVGVDDGKSVTESGSGTDKTYTLLDGGTTVVIGNGTIHGSVYGGGKIARVERNTVVTIGIGDGNAQTSKPTIKGSVYGAGKGVETHGYSALVRGKTTVTIKGDTKVEGTVYGGGDIASVGRFNVKGSPGVTEEAPTWVPAGMPYSLKYPSSESGNCYVTIGGYAEIGLNNMQMPTFSGHVFGAGKGILPKEYPYSGTDETHTYTGTTKPYRIKNDDSQETFTTEPAYITFIETLGMTGRTFVTIEDHAFVKGSVYGGSENGHVLYDTHVTIDEQCQIGIGAGENARYTDWTAESLAECASWPYGQTVGTSKVYLPYDVYDIGTDSKPKAASDGHTFYGNVFGGGSGYFPYRRNPAWSPKETGSNVDANGYSDGIWLRSAGAVYGNTYVDIKGGHILTSVYGGNECTDVGKYPTGSTIPDNGTGICTINMVGGTVGVPRTKEQKEAHPVVGNVYGAGKGDQRINFNTWTNVASTQVNITGDARIYGSTFGGGEDGHIIGDAETNIGGTVTVGTQEYTHTGVIIGTTGTSYFDGNVFGGGRGFSGDAQTAGTVGGNAEINIANGTVLGSVYGGGRLASVGTLFAQPENDNYGNFVEDETGTNAKTYGHVTVNISGGTIGNENATGDGSQYSGNVFGGSMGRLNLLNGTRNPIWPKMAQVKSAAITISGDNTVIRRNVYGGGELGTVRDDASVTINGGTVRRDVYGGGYGSEDMTHTIFTIPELISTNPDTYESHTYAFTPMQFAGCVGKNTYVNVAGGYIRKSVYGGGEMASVGVINYRAKETTTEPAADKVKIGPIDGKTYYYENIDKHGDAANGFALSWPYKFEYVTGFEGATHVNITGGRLGVKDTETEDEKADIGTDNGDVYGAGKGKAGDFNDYLFCANVGSTDVNIAYDSTPTAYSDEGDCIAGAVYGGGEDGHVMGDTKLTISDGLIYHSVYGGGSGKGKYSRKLLLSGKTYGSTNDSDYENRNAYSITAGKVFGNTEVNMTGGYVVRNIYGGGNMGSVGKGNYAGGTDDYSTAGYGEKVTNLWSNTDFLNSGKCTVKISGGTIGYIDAETPSNSMYPWNSSASLPYGNVFGGCRGEAVPNITDSPRYYYCPEFFVGYANETDVTIEGDDTKILGSVYGGGMDGHVRRDASVTVKGGEIGLSYDATNKGKVQTEDPDNIQWLARGNVYGAGSGIGKYGDKFCTSAGSVTRFTTVDIQGGTIHRNVYGGGSLASVGAPKIPADRTDNPTKAQTLNEVKISGGNIGGDYSYSAAGMHVYGGHVFGGSRGESSLRNAELSFSTSMFTEVNVETDANIAGSVFGGGEIGIVKGGVDVNINGGTINDDVYGGGALANTNTENSSDVPYTTTVNLYGGLIKGDAYGGGLGQLEEKTGETVTKSAIEAKVYGNVFVNLGKEDRSAATAFYVDKYTEGVHAGIVKSGRVFGCNNLNGSPQGTVTVTVNKTVKGNTEKTASDDLKSEDASKHTYHVATVYGGGNLAGKTVGGSTNVIINGCDVSIRDVYGGGNAAEVPATDVLVNGAYEIGEVFGGGNGKDDYTLDGGTTWETNRGANINGNANTLLLGGLIHEAYGGSNEKGTIAGSISINTGDNQPEDCTDCPLDVEKLVGAGKNADVNGDLIMILSCKPTTETPLVFGGADNANVNGNVELTIASGTYGQVFAGNNLGGVIKGHIKLNIEETGCHPIRIDELYLGGNQAAYSIYGYYEDTSDNNKLKPRTSADDSHTAVANPAADATHSFPYAQPELNVISCTYIGKVFGGGLGTGAAMYADPTVNINMIPGDYAATAVPAVMTEMGLDSSENPDKLGIIGDVYGGGNAADVIGNTTVNIGTAETVQLHQAYDATTGYTMSEDKNVKGAYIIGNVFGGGKGDDDTFLCEKGMIGADGDGVDHPNGGTTVNIYNGTIRGNVYGGGEIGRVEKNTTVTIGLGDGVAATDTPTSAPVVMGSVFGGGKGKETHGYAALVRGNPTVTVQGNAKVLKSVYGGGEIASVARYKVPRTEDEVLAAIAEGYDAVLDMPYALADPNNPSGNCKVIVRGYAEIGPDGMQMTRADGPDDTGYVFGAGKGILPGGEYAYAKGTTRRMVMYDKDVHTTANTNWAYVDPTHSDTNKNVWEYFADLDEYIRFIQTLALSSYTDVTIDGHAFVKGSVYGGSENGIVQYDTNVKVVNGQIGAADGENGECASWPYEAPYAPYDPYAMYKNPANGKYYYDAGFTQYAEGGAVNASDGHTYYGNVFGGGSGSVPYFDTTLGRSVYLNSAGQVKGKTNVTISGGHILTNVYGGCEATNVLDSAKVTMTGGTIGVERTDDQIQAHPVTGYIFGGGKGDQRVFFNKDTNVKDAVVKVEGGRIYGSVYGGGEDGHVLRNVTMTIGKATDHSGPTIGTKGTSYYDGNVFGGGRGFGGEALTAGNVGGAVTLDIEGGTMLGSVYGGGRLASVGYGLFDAETNSYGEMRADTDVEAGFTDGTSGFFTKGRGHVDITISGGTIGNDYEYKYIAPETTIDNSYRSTNHVPFTEFDDDKQLKHTKGGNVFAGGMGRMYQLDGTTPISAVDWWKVGCVKSTKLTISGGTIKSNVYGGGELGQVVGKQKNGTLGTEVIIDGGTIGTEIKDASDNVKYTFGSVFGGGYGSLVETLGSTYPKYIAGRVKGSTSVTMTGGAVKASVYGGGEMAAVGESRTLGETLTEGLGGNTTVTVSGGTIGKSGFGGAKMGNVYGGGSGHHNTVRSGHVYGNTNVNISGTDTRIYHNIYGGGAYGTVGDFTYEMAHDDAAGTNKVVGINGLHTERTNNSGIATVTITGGTIGVDGHENGMVFGSSRGDINEPDKRDDYTAWVYDANVIIGTEESATGPEIKGSVYGSGENGHTFNDAVVTVNSGTIGIASGSPIGTYTDGGASYPYRGNVYGGGCGTDKYDSNNDGTEDSYNALAGIVYGNATVNINGGTVVRNVYGAGAMGSVGKAVTADGVTTVSGGTTTINVSGGTIGVDGTAGDGNVFGAARGDVDAVSDKFALVRKETNVSVTDGTVKGNVYGGGEMGCVGTYTISSDYRTFTWQDTAGTTNTADNDKNTGICNVTVDGSSATINGHVFGAGKGKDDTFWCEKGIAYSTNVTISDGTVKGNVYGGGEVGRVETNTEVKIGSGAGTAGGASAPAITGSVFGGGAGVETHGYSALVRGNTTVTVEGNAAVGHSVYGGGEVASVGRYALDAQKMPSILQGGGYCYVTVQGNATVGADVFGAGEGVKSHFNNTDEDLSKRSRRMTLKSDWESRVGSDRFDWDYLTESNYPTYLETLALATHPEVTIDGSATIGKSVYGGGELGLTKGSVIVNIQGGTITEDVYGGGSLANTNTTSSVDSDGDGVADETVHPTTTVNLHSGTINRDVFGGGLGDANTAALVYGDVTVKLNETTASDNCVVKGSIFGCNNVNGTPKGHAKVHVFKTASAGHSHGYDVTSVFGGGKSADYVPADTKQSTEVIIEGCDLTSIEEVYGGGYGAATPGTNVLIKGTKIIDNVFGGGYGAGTDNPGANVGFQTGGADYLSGDGKAVVQLMAGNVNNVYGGSNTKGDVRGGSNVTNVANDGGPGCCDKLTVGEIYGGGRSADMYGGAEIVLGCMPNDWIGAIYAGAENADVHNDVSLTLTSGKFGRVFGGNNAGGNIDGYIEVNIEENPECSTPIIIGELYGGGNQASYTYSELADDPDYLSPRVNVRAFTSIGNIFGGGFGDKATVTGNPQVNISEVEGGREYAGETLTLDDGTEVTLYPRLATSKMGVIGTVFGGGNAAKVIGNTNVEIGTGDYHYNEGTQAKVKFVSTGEVKNVLGADIRDNVYGGGNAADVTGKTNVVIGKKTE